jgi:hypothetical protein
MRRCQWSDDTLRSRHGGEDNMTTSRISAVAIALSIALGFVGGAGSTQHAAKDQNMSGTIAPSKRMADGKEWTTANLNVTRRHPIVTTLQSRTAVDMAVCIRGNRRSEDVSR